MVGSQIFLEMESWLCNSDELVRKQQCGLHGLQQVQGVWAGTEHWVTGTEGKLEMGAQRVGSEVGGWRGRESQQRDPSCGGLCFWFREQRLLGRESICSSYWVESTGEMMAAGLVWPLFIFVIWNTVFIWKLFHDKKKKSVWSCVL